MGAVGACSTTNKCGAFGRSKLGGRSSGMIDGNSDLHSYWQPNLVGAVVLGRDQQQANEVPKAGVSLTTVESGVPGAGSEDNDELCRDLDTWGQWASMTGSLGSAVGSSGYSYSLNPIYRAGHSTRLSKS